MFVDQSVCNNIILYFRQTKLRRLFARIYVKNPLRLETFSNLYKHELMKVKDCVINGEDLKVVVIARHKSAWSIGYGHFFMSHEEAEIWKECLRDLGPDDTVFPSAKQLGKDVKKVTILDHYFVMFTL